MAVIHFTPADALQTTVVEANLYPSEITRIDGPTKSSSGKSVNYTVDIQITEGKYKGKSRTVMFNSESNNVSMLGDMQFFPQSQFLLLDSAINGREVKAEQYALDLESLLHKPFEASWAIATVDGHMVNTISSFHPKGYSAKPTPF